MKIRFEMQTSLGRVWRSFSLSTSSVARDSSNRIAQAVLAVVVIVLVLLIADAAGILTQVNQVVNLLGSQMVVP